MTHCRPRWRVWWLVLGGLLAASCRPAAPEQGGVRLAAGDSPRLTIKGSDTMVNLVSMWAEAYMQQHPDVEVSVTGGGSGTGFAALLNGTTDICAASRAMLPKETELADERGIHPAATVVARDGVAIIVHPTNRLASLSIEQIRKIYSGALDNWQQLGGPDRKIVVNSRDSSSGTYVFFQLHVLERRDFRRDARLLPASTAIVQAVAEDAGAIGYVGLGYAEEARGEIRAVPVSEGEGAAAVAPTQETVASNEYPLARPLQFYTRETPIGAVQQFIAFCRGPAGQQVVRRSGYVVVNQ